MFLQIVIFVAVTVVALLLLRVGSDAMSGRGRVLRRLAEEFSPAAITGPGPLYKNLESLGRMRDEIAASSPSAPPRRRFDWRERCEEFLRQADVPLAAEQFIWVSIASAGIGGLAGGLAASGVAGLFGALAGCVAPLALVAIRRKRRREKYVKQLVGAFEMMARALRAGQSMPEAFRAAVESFEDPLGGEFAQCLHQIEHGIRPEEAFRELSRRSGILELRIFVVAMTIQRQTGGNMSEVLDRLAAVVRARLRVRQKIRALTAEGRLQSITLTVLPMATFGVMYAVNRPYAQALLAQPKLLLATAGCMAIGVAWIRHIMNFEG